MKLKALKPRLYNAMFHTHTVSGIVISFALFICFYCGAVAVFLDELYQWENPQARVEYVPADKVEYDKVISVVDENTKDFDKSGFFGIVPPSKKNPTVTFYGRNKNEEGGFDRLTEILNPQS